MNGNSLNKENKLDERFNLLSAYFGRWASVIIFALIVSLAIAALLIDSEDLAHTQIAIGVLALDSTRSSAALGSLSDFCREKGIGDIRWRFSDSSAKCSPCDFYLLPSLSAIRYIDSGNCKTALLVAERQGHRYSRSAVIVAKNTRALPSKPRIIFSSPASAAGFVAPAKALQEAGVSLEEAAIEFSGDIPRDERTILGVVHGVYDAGGISLERLLALRARGIYSDNELEVIYQGEAVPEMLLVCEQSRCTRQKERFIETLRRSFDQAPEPLRRELASIGIAAFYELRESDLELIRKISTFELPARASGDSVDSGRFGNSSRFRVLARRDRSL